MSANFQSSFIPNIPRDPSEEGIFKKEKTSVIGVLGLSVFILAILASAGAFAYRWFLQGQVDELKNQLITSEKAIDKETINQMIKFDHKLQMTKNIVSRHQIISNFLSLLSQNTVSAVDFDTFYFGSYTPGSSFGVDLGGTASSYGSLALQESVLLNNPSFQSADFSNLSLASGGRVSFSLTFTVDPKVFLYQNQVEGGSPDGEEFPNGEGFGLDEDLESLESDLLDFELEIPGLQQN